MPGGNGENTTNNTENSEVVFNDELNPVSDVNLENENLDEELEFLNRLNMQQEPAPVEDERERFISMVRRRREQRANQENEPEEIDEAQEIEEIENQVEEKVEQIQEYVENEPVFAPMQEDKERFDEMIRESAIQAVEKEVVEPDSKTNNKKVDNVFEYANNILKEDYLSFKEPLGGYYMKLEHREKIVYAKQAMQKLAGLDQTEKSLHDLKKLKEDFAAAKSGLIEIMQEKIDNTLARKKIDKKITVEQILADKNPRANDEFKDIDGNLIYTIKDINIENAFDAINQELDQRIKTIETAQKADAFTQKSLEVNDKLSTESIGNYYTTVITATMAGNNHLMEMTKDSLIDTYKQLLKANKGSFFNMFRKESPEFKALREGMKDFIEHMGFYKPDEFFKKLDKVKQLSDTYAAKRANSQDEKQRARGQVAQSISNMISKHSQVFKETSALPEKENEASSKDRAEFDEGINKIIEEYHNKDIKNPIYDALKEGILSAAYSLLGLRRTLGPAAVNDPTAKDGLLDLEAMVSVYTSMGKGANLEDCNFRLDNLLGEKGVLEAARAQITEPGNLDFTKALAKLTNEAPMIGDYIRENVTVVKMKDHIADQKESFAKAKENIAEKTDVAKTRDDSSIKAESNKLEKVQGKPMGLMA